MELEFIKEFIYFITPFLCAWVIIVLTKDWVQKI